MIARRMYGYMIDRFKRFQLIFFDIPSVALPIGILSLTIIEMQSTLKLTYVITILSGLSTILSFLNKMIAYEKKISLVKSIKFDYDRLNMEIEVINTFDGGVITDGTLLDIEKRLEAVTHKDEGVVPEHILQKFMGDHKNILKTFYTTPEREEGGANTEYSPRNDVDVTLDVYTGSNREIVAEEIAA